MSARIVPAERLPDAWAALRVRLWPDLDLADSRAEIEAQDGNTDGAAFIALSEDGTPAGFVELSLRGYAEGCEGAPVPYVEGWYVEPALRGRGIGRMLVATAEAWARERGFRELASDTQLDNTDSQAAHGALGFQEVERIVVFRKPL